MGEFEEIDVYKIAPYGVYFTVHENTLLVDFEEKLRTCDIVMVDGITALKMFGPVQKLKDFARQRGFKTVWDWPQKMWVCQKDLPWIE